MCFLSAERTYGIGSGQVGPQTVCVPLLRGLDEDFLSTGGLGMLLEWVFHKLRMFGILIFSDVPG